jgi:hypothetical protein
MAPISLTDLMMELDTMAAWTQEIRTNFGLLDGDTVLIREAVNWRENPPIIRPPRTSLCIQCIQETRTNVTARDLFQALTNLQDWLTSLKVDVAAMRGGEVEPPR